MKTKLEQIAAKAVKQRPKSVVREIRTPRSVGTGGGRPPPVARWALSNGCPYRNRCALIAKGAALVAPPDSVVSGCSLKLPYNPQWVGGPSTARGLTHRDDRSASSERSPE